MTTTMALETALAAAVAGLSTVVTVLWRRVSRSFKGVEERLGKCEEDREQLWRELAKRK